MSPSSVDAYNARLLTLDSLSKTQHISVTYHSQVWADEVIRDVPQFTFCWMSAMSWRPSPYIPISYSVDPRQMSSAFQSQTFEIARNDLLAFPVSAPNDPTSLTAAEISPCSSLTLKKPSLDCAKFSRTCWIWASCPSMSSSWCCKPQAPFIGGFPWAMLENGYPKKMITGWWFGCHQIYFPRNI